MNGGIFSGLESFGLEGLSDMKLYEEKKKAEEPKAEPKKVVTVVEETDFLLEKTIECPVCSTKFKALAVKGNKCRLIGTDRDLRPKYDQIDILKYDAVLCTMCGYAGLTRYFANVMPHQKKAIKEKVCPAFKTRFDNPKVYDYDEALGRYKMALVNAVVKGAKPSEKAYICLKSAWVIRGKLETMDPSAADYESTKAIENEYISNAYEGFVAAVQTETFPMCGMDESTMNYLLGVLAYNTGHYDVAGKEIAKVLQSAAASNRIKDKARELKTDLLKVLKNK